MSTAEKPALSTDELAVISPQQGLVGRATDTLDRAVAHLLERQDPAGWWKGELETNVTIEAEDLLLREFLDIRQPEQTAETARWIRSKQREDGSWATFFGGPADVSTTVEAWVALRLAGDAAEAPHLQRAAEFVRANGGVQHSRVFTRIWLSLFGLWSWDDVPVMPPELILLPKWAPLNIYNWACWARQTIVPLTLVQNARPVHPVPFGIEELWDRTGPADRRRPFWDLLDAALRRYERHPVGWLRRRARAKAERWIVAHQEADGSWGGIQPPWVYSLLALRILGYPVDHPVIRNGLAGLDDFTVREQTEAGIVRRIEACQSPVWDTALAVIALLDAGLPAEHPSLGRAVDWLLRQEVTVPGDWAVRRPKLAASGWPFEFANLGYPDVDDTAEVVLALHRCLPADPARIPAAISRAVDWTVGMQSRDGGWAAFDADNTKTLATKLPFCDFGAVIDPPSADVTAHVIEMLGAGGQADVPAARRGIAWLLRAQEPDGSWFGRWGANYVYGTGAAVPALRAAGFDPGHPAIRRAVRWLAEHQNDDGGWGEDLRSYRDRSWIGAGTSTASQTAWALMALLAAGERSEVVRRGVEFLVDSQRPDGSWDEPQFTGTGFPGDFYINYHLYRAVFPISALGRFLTGAAAFGEAAAAP
ncbi:MAG TPA: squalene--hopene cyclase [Jatrophihabitans sp.]|nr:squalene--hopene cyclase [Jatrophihabitans sp.]